jgi:curved DNA-binding protein CbpA
MSAGTEEFTSPDIEAADYYTRLGAPEDAEASDIERHIKKYVREYMPQGSNHERAEERWKRFNEARNTLKEPEEKTQYDTFRERFGAERGTEAFEAWEARDRPGDPTQLDPVRDLGMPAEGKDDQDSTRDRHQERTERDGRDQDRQRHTENTQSRYDDRRRTGERQRRRDADLNVDLDSTVTHSTRTPDSDRTEETTETKTGVISQVLEHARVTTALGIQEVTTVFSMLELVVAAYLVYVVLVQVLTPVVTSVGGGVLLQDVVTAAVTLGLGYGLARQYLRRFAGEPLDLAALDLPVPHARLFGEAESDSPPGRRILERMDRPETALLVPVAAAALFGGVFLLGGGGVALFLFGAALLSVYARTRVIDSLRSTPEWGQYADVVGGVGVGLSFLTTYGVASPPGGLSSGAPGDVAVLIVLTLAMLVAVVSPIAPAAVTRLNGE